MKYLQIFLLITVLFLLNSCDDRNADLPELSLSYDSNTFLSNYINHNLITVTVSLEGLNSLITDQRIDITYNHEYMLAVTQTGYNNYVRTDSLGFTTFDVLVEDVETNYGQLQIEFEMADYSSVNDVLTLFVHDMPRFENIQYNANMNLNDDQYITVTFNSETDDQINQLVTMVPEVGTVQNSQMTTDENGEVTFKYYSPSTTESETYIDIYLNEYQTPTGNHSIKERITINF